MSENEKALVEKKEQTKAVGFSMRLIPQSFDEAMKLAGAMAKSGIVPTAMAGKPEACLVAIGFGMELGLPPMQAVQNIMVVNGRPTLWGDACLALVFDSGLMEKFDEDTPDVALKNGTGRCTVKRIGMEARTFRFSLEDAKKAGLVGKPGPWQNYPGRMLMFRARSWALRDNFPDVLKGLIPREEVDDYPTQRPAPPVVHMATPKSEAKPPAPIAEIIEAQLAEPVPGDGQEPVFDDPISMTERQVIFGALAQNRVDLKLWKAFVESLGVHSSAELPKSKLSEVNLWIEAHKDTAKKSAPVAA